MIKELLGRKPHKDWGGWSKFLKSCELREEARGVKFYGKANCNYILFPCDTLVMNYGYHGRVLMEKIRKEGTKKTLADLKESHQT